jgi:hypothetical protein
MRIVSNHSPALAALATSCLVSSIRCGSVIRSHSGVPNRLLRCGGIQYAPEACGASQSISTAGSWLVRAEASSSLAAVTSRASTATSRY